MLVVLERRGHSVVSCGSLLTQQLCLHSRYPQGHRRAGLAKGLGWARLPLETERNSICQIALVVVVPEACSQWRMLCQHVLFTVV